MNENDLRKRTVYYSWDDEVFRDFMIELLHKLQPRFEREGEILFQELEEINEIFFVCTGQVDIGYNINRERKYVIRYSDRTMIGAYNCTFNKRAIFLYKCKSDCSGQFIRKEHWKDLMESFEVISR